MAILRRGTALLGAACLMTLSACGGGDGGTEAQGEDQDRKEVTLTWWHNGASEPLKGFWQEMADQYHQMNPNVKIEVVTMQNEQFNTKLPAAMQSNDPPDLFQAWGGGQMATQVEAGKLKDLTELIPETIESVGPSASGWQVDGRQYGIPYSFGVVGFWYNKQLFKKAGIAAPPATYEEFLADVAKLKAAGITPVAVGGKDKWPDAFWWDYFAVRACSKETLQKSARDYDFSDSCWISAGTNTQRLLDAKPFQPAFLSTSAQQGAGSSAGLLANGKAAMELQGHWNPGVLANLTTKKEAMQQNLGWFPFPAVTGGQGAPNAALGGGDGFACSFKAPKQCEDFLKYIMSVDNQRKYGLTNAGLPVVKGSEDGVKDPALKDLIAFRNNASYVQTYLDIAFVTSVGKAVNDAIAQQFAGKVSAAEVVEMIKAAAEDR